MDNSAPHPLFDDLWAYDQPAQTEARLLALLPAAEAGSDADYLGQLLTQIARTYSLRHDFATARDWLQRAEAVLGPDTAVARIRWLLENGRTYNSAGDKTTARHFFARALDAAQPLGLDYYAVDAAHMLAIAAANHDEAIDWNHKAIALANASHNPRTRQWLGALTNNLAWELHDLGRYDEALLLFTRALQWRETEASPRSEAAIRIARWAVARTLRSLGRLNEALAGQQALLAEWQAAGEEDGYVHEELGELWLARGRPDDARPHFARAYALLHTDPWLAQHEPARLARLARLGALSHE